MRIFSIAILLFTIAACQHVGFQKRKHLKGYYFSHAPRLKKEDNNAAYDIDKTDSIRLNTISSDRKTVAATTVQTNSVATSVNRDNECVKNEALSTSTPTIIHKEEIKQVVPASNTIKIVSNKKALKSELMAKAKSKDDNTHEFIGWYGLIGLSLVGFAHARRNKKARLTTWTSKNRKKGIALIIAGLGVNYVSTVYLGRNLGELGFTSDGFTRDVLIGLTGLSILSFPTNRRFLNNFKNRSRAFTVLFVLISALGINSGIRMQNQAQLSFTEQHIATYTADQKEAIQHKEPFSGNELAWRIPLTILFILSNVAIGVLLLYLVCSLACSGLGVLAVLAGVLGYGGIIVGMIFTLRAIWRKPGSGKLPKGEGGPEKDPDENYFTQPARP